MTGVAVFKSADFVGLPVHFNTYDLGHINGKTIIQVWIRVRIFHGVH